MEGVLRRRRPGPGGFHARDLRIAHLDVTGARLVDVDAHGKWLLLRFESGQTVSGHLRIDDAWDLGRRSTAPEWQRRLELEMDLVG